MIESDASKFNKALAEGNVVREQPKVSPEKFSLTPAEEFVLGLAGTRRGALRIADIVAKGLRKDADALAKDLGRGVAGAILSTTGINVRRRRSRPDQNPSK